MRGGGGGGWEERFAGELGRQGEPGGEGQGEEASSQAEEEEEAPRQHLRSRRRKL